jgi:23S rRNA-intervening sequence protein
MKESSIQSYRDLKVWQEGMNLVETCYRVTKTFPKEETYGMTSQIRRAAVSIPANIAEGYGRKTRGEYIPHSALHSVVQLLILKASIQFT